MYYIMIPRNKAGSERSSIQQTHHLSLDTGLNLQSVLEILKVKSVRVLLFTGSISGSNMSAALAYCLGEVGSFYSWCHALRILRRVLDRPGE